MKHDGLLMTLGTLAAFCLADVTVFGSDLVLATRNVPAAYCVVIPEKASPSVRYAAEELCDHLEKVTGVRLPVVPDAATLPEKAILLGETRHSLGLLADASFAPAKLGEDGFRLAVRGDRLLVYGSSVRGALYGVYEVLERFAGCRWYSSWHTVTPARERVGVPATLDETQVPAFAMREPFFYDMNNNIPFSTRNKVNGHNQIGHVVDAKFGGESYRFGGGLGSCHTFAALMPSDEFFATHPEYFAEVNGKRAGGYAQPCLSHPDVLRIVTERVLKRIREDPSAKFYGVSQNDNDLYCRCAKCAAVDAEEGSPAGSMVRFVNAVAERVEKEFPHAVIETLAYCYTRKPPKKTRLRHNVVPCLCTIECDFARSLDKSPYPQNISFRKDIEGWKTQTDQLYIWDYVTDFSHYTLPFANVLALQDNVRFFRDNNVKELFEQGSYQGNHGDFAELKAWLLAKWMWNPELPAETLLQDFFNGYYGKGAPYVRKYFDELHRRQLAWSNDPTRPLRIYASPTSIWFSDEYLDEAAGLWAQALEAVKDDSVRSYNVRMGAFCVDYTRFRRLYGTDERVLRLVNPPSREAYQKLQTLAKSLIACDEEAKRVYTKREICLTENGNAEAIRTAWRKVAETDYETETRRYTPKGGEVPAGRIEVTGTFEGHRYGEHVDDPRTLDGKAVKLYNTHWEWSAIVRLEHIAFEPGRRYRVRIRARCEKAGEGEAFYAGVWDAGRNTGLCDRAWKTSEVGPEYAWYEVGTFAPVEPGYLWIGPGRFAKDGASAIKALWIDRVEFTRVDDIPKNM